MFWALLAVLAFTYFVGPLLQPKPKGLKADTDEVEPPTAEKGTPIPVVYGTQKIACNVTWWGNVHAEDIRTVTGNRTLLNPFAVNHSQVTGHRYGADIAGVLCHGPIDELVDLVWQDTSLRKYTTDNTNYVAGPGGVPVLTTPMTPALPQVLPAGNTAVNFTIKAPDLFGGDDGNGGVQATLELWFGKLTQNASATLAAKVGEAVSNYKGICHFVLYNATFGTSPYLQPFWAVVRRTPQLVSIDAATANIGGSANGADVIYEVMTDTRWGLGLSPAAFDFASFRAAAATLKAEGMGLDFSIGAQDSAEAIVGEVLRHIDGVVFTHPETGLITLKLARADYDPATVPVLDKSSVTGVGEYKRNTWPETYNEVKVNYQVRGTTYPLLFVTDSQQAQNLASMQAMGQVVASTPYDFMWFSDPQIALKAAFRTLRVLSVPLASCTLVVNRKAHAFTIGSVFKLNWEPLGITGLLLRVTGIKAGALDNNSMQISCVEDVFSTAPAVFVTPPATSWVAPVTTPQVHVRALALPANYYLTRGDQFIGLNMVVRAGGSSTSWDGYYNNDPTTPDGTIPTSIALTTGSPFCPAGTLTAIYRYTSAYQDEVGIIVQDLNSDMSKLLGTDAAGLTRGDLLAYIDGPDGGEVIAWRDIVPQATVGQYLIKGILRGQFDTAPLDHKVGDAIYFFYPDHNQPYYPGQDVSTTPPTASSQTLATSGYKLWPAMNGITSSLPPSAPTAKIAIPVTNTPSLDPRRAVFPPPVGNMQLNGVKNNVLDPNATLPDSNTLTWVTRNRLTQTAMVLHDAATIAPEAGETYEIDVVHVSRTTGLPIFGVLRTVAPATSPYTYTNIMFETDIKALNGGVKVPDADARRTGGGIRFLVRSVRSGLKSYDMALPGFNRGQVTGYPIIPSLQFTNIASLLVPPEPPFIEGVQYAVDIIST
jgi:hypothetical protein